MPQMWASVEAVMCHLSCSRYIKKQKSHPRLLANGSAALLSFFLFLFLLRHNLRLKLGGSEGSAWLLRYTQPCQFRFQLLRVCSFGDVATFGNSAFRL